MELKTSEMEISDKANNRTHHTRFFEKLYGNLEKPSHEDEAAERIKSTSNHRIELHLNNDIGRPDLGSPSASSGSSSDIFHPEIAQRPPIYLTSNDIGLTSFSNAILPSPFGALRMPPIGFTGDPHNHFAAFLARRRRKEGRQRRQRTTFSSDQTLKLEVEFNRNEYISRGRRFELAENLQLSETQIKIWFQNRRAKDKRIEKAQIDQQYRNFAAASGLLPFGIGYPQQTYITSPSTNASYSSALVNPKYSDSKLEHSS